MSGQVDYWRILKKFPLPFFPMAFTPMVPTQELHSAAANERARFDLDFSMTFMQIEPYSLDLTNANMFMNWSLNWGLATPAFSKTVGTDLRY